MKYTKVGLKLGAPAKSRARHAMFTVAYVSNEKVATKGAIKLREPTNSSAWGEEC